MLTLDYVSNRDGLWNERTRGDLILMLPNMGLKSSPSKAHQNAYYKGNKVVPYVVRIKQRMNDKGVKGMNMCEFCPIYFWLALREV